MRVALDARYAEGHLAGIGKYIKNLAEGLAKRKIEVTLIYSQTPKSRIRGKGISSVILSNPNRYFFEQVLLPTVLHGQKIDLYHATGNLGVPLFSTKPAVLTVHDIIPLEFKGYFGFSKWPALSELSYSLRLKSSCSKAKKIITISNFTKRRLIRKVGIEKSKIKVITSGVSAVGSADKFPRGLIKGKYILNHGGLDVRKNLEMLLVAFSIIHNKFPEIKIVITGENPGLEAKLVNLAKLLGIYRSVLFTGYVSEEKLWKLIKYAACICYPTLMEGFGAPVLEGFKAGVPVISSNITSIPEISGKAAILIDPREEGKISKALTSILTNRRLAARMIERGRAQAKKYDWDNAIEKTLAVYREILT